MGTVSLEVKVQSPYKLGKFTHVRSECPKPHKFYCTIKYENKGSARVYYLAPRAVYKGSETSIYVDPDCATNDNENLPFDSASIDTVNMIFDRGVDGNTVLHRGARNEVKSRSSSQAPRLSSNFLMEFENGAAVNYQPTMDMCLPEDGSLCY